VKNNVAILSIGAYDTKQDELAYLNARMQEMGAAVVRMDVGVLGAAADAEIANSEIAQAAGKTLAEVADTGGENEAFQLMARGAAKIAGELYAEGKIDGMIALGGSMGTDLALDVALALPLGAPKHIVSTVSFSHLIPPSRFAADLQMTLWAGGLYGLNDVCKASLSQAAGAVVGACRAVEKPDWNKPLIGMTSLGSSCLRYMKTLKPALEERGFETSVFHSTGMGGMAFEKLAREGAFVCVMDFCLQEFVNMLAKSVVSAGDDRLTGAGASATPQMVAPGALDLLDFAGWQEPPASYRERPFHTHNRLIKSAIFTAEERRAWIREAAARLRQAKGETHFFLPLRGVEEWDREGGDAHDPEGLRAMIDEARQTMPDAAKTTEVDAHINDDEFCRAVLSVFDQWVERGIVSRTPRKAPSNPQP